MEYIERAIALGFERYSVTEHSPLPAGWLKDPDILRSLAMPESQLLRYLDTAHALKERYRSRIELRVGLELDYLHGMEEYTLDLVDRCAGGIDDIVLSVHYLPGKGGMRCVDHSTADFHDGLLGAYGSMGAVADAYFEHVERAIALAKSLGPTRRIGHILLIEKFRADLPTLEDTFVRSHLHALLGALEGGEVGVDVNAAGLRLESCGIPYVPGWFVGECLQRAIPFVFGSDAHRPEEVGAGWEWYERTIAELAAVE